MSGRRRRAQVWAEAAAQATNNRICKVDGPALLIPMLCIDYADSTNGE